MQICWQLEEIHLFIQCYSCIIFLSYIMTICMQLCHVYHYKCRFKEAVQFMEKCSRTWSSLSSFMCTHNWWHVALCYLEGHSPMEKVRDVYDQNIWKELERSDPSQAKVYLNAVGLLLRVYVRGGINVFGDRLKILADCLTNMPNNITGFYAAAIHQFLLLMFLCEHRSEWVDNDIDAYADAAVKVGPCSLPGARVYNFGGQVILPLAHTAEHEELLEVIKLELGRICHSPDDFIMPRYMFLLQLY
uniref:Uncharacterized protein LOC104213455 isoform X4 n=1 Tax=Nicotiana sylvestris TaxID=4096 RepID=A0A1U7UZ20_NICSY|nr:PREDICTED: uncharacterized protein LOC104213455 isoform X4 [Nicotiana sylvestris]